MAVFLGYVRSGKRTTQQMFFFRFAQVANRCATRSKLLGGSCADRSRDLRLF